MEPLFHDGRLSDSLRAHEQKLEGAAQAIADVRYSATDHEWVMPRGESARPPSSLRLGRYPDNRAVTDPAQGVLSTRAARRYVVTTRPAAMGGPIVAG
jgi:hypothetical protein